MKVTCLTYEFCRKRHPELKLPAWQDLTAMDRRRAKRMTVEKLRVRRFTVLMARDPGVVDRLKFGAVLAKAGGNESYEVSSRRFVGPGVFDRP